MSMRKAAADDDHEAPAGCHLRPLRAGAGRMPRVGRNSGLEAKADRNNRQRAWRRLLFGRLECNAPGNQHSHTRIASRSQSRTAIAQNGGKAASSFTFSLEESASLLDLNQWALLTLPS